LANGNYFLFLSRIGNNGRHGFALKVNYFTFLFFSRDFPPQDRMPTSPNLQNPSNKLSGQDRLLIRFIVKYNFTVLVSFALWLFRSTSLSIDIHGPRSYHQELYHRTYIQLINTTIPINILRSLQRKSCPQACPSALSRAESLASHRTCPPQKPPPSSTPRAPTSPQVV
jgi:hypothetical protein